ncbi:DUF5681 domain-containing protein [Thiorhodovibrio frisius]|uniref:DUF5681 domain-containing protein n=1 Tax=Thiorhodovibrio frisius TaxID=631362 RepID=H8Z709_9GAMM|nr:DUF5681 domain-containing protein [Thiorhodovibrio frisius]EIC20808.1 hypothetical protein Thi970DRAFT_04471 [Thiorhodovibrio frisius]WPL21859.1 hypothetical protein Thiofri_01996 [Thiorhodovibrio frisius]
MATTRDPKGRFRAGTSGNKAGRPPGSGSSPGVLLRREIAKHGPVLLKKMLASAKDGDMDALTWLLDRVIPKLRAEPAPVHVDLTGAAQEISTRLLTAVSDGSIAPETATELLTLVRETTATDTTAPPDLTVLDRMFDDAVAKAQADRDALRAERGQEGIA